MSHNVQLFDQWIRSGFTQLNTELEELYFAQADRANVAGVGEATKRQLHDEGRAFIGALLHEGNTDEGFERGFDLLGNVGLYMAACGRHGITQAERESSSPLYEASALALQLGASLGVTPRFATSHLTTHNRAINGQYKSFTSLPDEYLFTEYNTRAVMAYKRAADALLRVLPLGVSHPVAHDLLRAALEALGDVTVYNRHLFEHLDTDRFFYCVRPYFKPHRVGLHIYRGANAGDFSGINAIDLLLGLCRADHAYYAQLLVDKFLYIMPEDQAMLRDCMRRRSLMDEFLGHSGQHRAEHWYRSNLALFLEVCERHGETAAQHHDQLVRKFIELPAVGLDERYQENLTASGPPLPVLLKALEKLRDLRMAADREDIPSRHADMQRLRASLN
ncbi:MAG TPA: monodechloroaminopyrrolnitrin synthase PrnB family protein [Xanthomonadales bacterium]|nr:monodechloroaminopyrrolnitrin synthase PrnB family protein [Xanthomonadales bacterium]